jgi:hypothetical protein
MPEQTILADEPQQTNGEAAPETDAESWYDLDEPITVGTQKIPRLKVDSRELSGTKFFEILENFNRTYPRLAALALNKYDTEQYLGLVIAELNQITPEDLRKLSFTELPLLFMRARSFVYAGGRRK